MHIPDHFLSTPVWGTLDALAVPAVAFVSRHTPFERDSSRLPLLGVMGAFVFAAQMVNFPVGVGTSGHLVGGTLLAALLGPSMASLVVTAILLVQAMVFQDGGVLALGANVVNMAMLGVIAGYLPLVWLRRTRWRLHGIFLGGFCSVMTSGVMALSELSLSGIRMSGTLIGASLFLFAVNAAMEGAITVAVIRAIEKLNPEIAHEPLGSMWPGRQVRVTAALSVGAFVLASAGILIASTKPDGLEHLAARLGLDFGTNPLLRSPLADYKVYALGSGWLSRAAAGLAGLLIIYTVCVIAGHLLARMRRTYS